MNRVNIQPQAQAEAEQAAAWYETQRTGLGIEFVLELDAAIEWAAESPEMYAMQYREARRVLVRRFPYAVYFIYESGTRGICYFAPTARIIVVAIPGAVMSLHNNSPKGVRKKGTMGERTRYLRYL